MPIEARKTSARAQIAEVGPQNGGPASDLFVLKTSLEAQILAAQNQLHQVEMALKARDDDEIKAKAARLVQQAVANIVICHAYGTRFLAAKRQVAEIEELLAVFNKSAKKILLADHRSMITF